MHDGLLSLQERKYGGELQRVCREGSTRCLVEGLCLSVWRFRFTVQEFGLHVVGREGRESTVETSSGKGIKIEGVESDELYGHASYSEAVVIFTQVLSPSPTPPAILSICNVPGVNALADSCYVSSAWNMRCVGVCCMMVSVLRDAICSVVLIRGAVVGGQIEDEVNGKYAKMLTNDAASKRKLGEE
eukprot:2116056-Rhodomonas_salina.2